ncbi:MAG: RdgB/HAM1 family non-canonical purine NTP pyrophosphatase [Treponema sp.]|jgi:XTP/dITP diphosphohydrolase|nr:RdgB/HAM1 family non-canonical purine NTP pyrophosphatase [Treponema sp.]
MTIWFATGNAHKKTELEAILSGLTITIPADAGISDFDPAENGTTFLENALIKARALYNLVKQPVIADDSGLCVDALGGRPGIHSARYGSEGKANLTSTERNALVLKELGDTSQRRARFVCAMVLLFNTDRFWVAQETLEGEILREERGSRGFGYDPILYVPSLGAAVAELSEETKNRISHRGKAGQIIRRIAEQVLD